MKVLCIAPHPDDEAIGCGGALRKHVLDGDEVHVLYITSGEMGATYNHLQEQDKVYNGSTWSQDIDVIKSIQRMREREAGVCSQVLGTHKLKFLRLPDGQLNAYYKDIEADLRERMRKFDLVYAPHTREAHADHQQVAYAVIAASYTGGTHNGTPINFYEVWTPLERPRLHVDITSVVDVKRSAIRAHASQLYNGFDEAILALNRYRGQLLGPNKMYMEVFG